MSSPLNALPLITATALGSNTNTPGLVGGNYRNPIAVGGYAVGMDSLNFYVQHQGSAAGAIGVNSTATGTQTGPEQPQNTVHKGIIFYATVASVGATCTIGVNLLADDGTGNTGLGATSWPVARASLDGIVASGNYALEFYPGMVAGGGGPSQGTNYTQAQGVLPAYWKIQVSVTATASGGGANLTYNFDYCKIL